LESYELTDRGKIIITVVLVVLLLFLPAAILLYTAMTSQPSLPPENSDSQASFTPPPAPSETPNPPTTESPPPNGGGFNPPEVSPPNGQDTNRPPGSGQNSVNPTEGTLSFLFSPNLHSTLDAESTSMLDEFLSSPKNTSQSIVAVETPQLPPEVFDVFVPVIVDAFTERGVVSNRIAYITDPTVPLADGPFMVNMSYITQRPK